VGTHIKKKTQNKKGKLNAHLSINTQKCELVIIFCNKLTQEDDKQPWFIIVVFCSGTKKP
jgi:hypothetical protein